jgi:hypothetical protein
VERDLNRPTAIRREDNGHFVTARSQTIGKLQPAFGTVEHHGVKLVRFCRCHHLTDLSAKPGDACEEERGSETRTRQRDVEMNGLT